MLKIIMNAEVHARSGTVRFADFLSEDFGALGLLLDGVRELWDVSYFLKSRCLSYSLI